MFFFSSCQFLALYKLWKWRSPTGHIFISTYFVNVTRSSGTSAIVGNDVGNTMQIIYISVYVSKIVCILCSHRQVLLCYILYKVFMLMGMQNNAYEFSITLFAMRVRWVRIQPSPFRLGLYSDNCAKRNGSKTHQTLQTMSYAYSTHHTLQTMSYAYSTHQTLQTMSYAYIQPIKHSKQCHMHIQPIKHSKQCHMHIQPIKHSKQCHMHIQPIKHSKQCHMHIQPIKHSKQCHMHNQPIKHYKQCHMHNQPIKHSKQCHMHNYDIVNMLPSKWRFIVRDKLIRIHTLVVR